MIVWRINSSRASPSDIPPGHRTHSLSSKPVTIGCAEERGMQVNREKLLFFCWKKGPAP